METVSSQLKRAERSVEDYENQVLPLSAPSFATPQKRDRGGSNSSAEGPDDSKEDVRRRLEEAERRLLEKDRELRDMEAKMFEGRLGTASSSSLDEVSVGGGSASSFDDMPLPTSRSSAKMGAIADRAKASSIAFDYQVRPRPSFASLAPPSANLSSLQCTPPNKGRSAQPTPSADRDDADSSRKIRTLEGSLEKVSREKQGISSLEKDSPLDSTYMQLDFFSI